MEELVPTPTVDPIARLRRFAIDRILVLCCSMAVIVVASLFVPGLTVFPLLAVIATLLVLSLGILVLLRGKSSEQVRRLIQRRLIQAQITMDLLGMALAIHYSGGAENPFFPLLAFPAILAAALLSPRAAYGFAGIASVVYAFILIGEWLGWLPHHHLGGLTDPLLYGRGILILGQSLSLGITCFLAAYITSKLVGALHTRAEELAESHQRAEVRARQLRELNGQLRAANLECRHSREQLDSAYAELQQAYSRLQTRSSHMSELNEQLRAANAECKARREELAEVNQKLQEAYKRIETRAERMRDLNEQLREANAECKSRRDELARLNQQLERANIKLMELEDVRAQFTLLVTHELRAPVAAIQSYLKLILEGYVPEAKLRTTLEKAEKRAMDQLALISDLLELGRIGSADARGRVHLIQIEQSLVEQIDLLAASAHERNITVNTDIGAHLPAILSNPDQIKSLWNNLVSNAIKYNRDNGRVDISIQQKGDRLEVVVRDTGIGIPPEARARLFSEFFRADNAKASGKSGTGLGLSIVKEIVERTGGKIEVESELDKGTTFSFWFPVPKAIEVHAEDAAATTPDEANSLSSAKSENEEEN